MSSAFWVEGMASAHAHSAAAAHAEHARRQRKLPSTDVRLSGLLLLHRASLMGLFDFGALCQGVQHLETIQHLGC